jgi:hypothetical protein
MKRKIEVGGWEIERYIKKGKWAGPWFKFKCLNRDGAAHTSTLHSYIGQHAFNAVKATWPKDFKNIV